MSNVRRCPKCGGLPSRYTEIWDGHSIVFLVDGNDGVPEEEGDLREGWPTRVIAACGECDWLWRLRGVQQITDLFPHKPLAHAGPAPTPSRRK